MEYKTGILTKTADGWAVNDGGKMIPLDDQYYNPANQSKSFVWDDCRYNDGETIKYTIYDKYVEPPPNIHSNRGGTTPIAQIVEDWDHIFQRIPLGRAPHEDYLLLANFLKEHYGEPRRIK